MNDPVNLQTNLKEALLTAFNKYKEKTAIRTNKEDISYSTLYKRSCIIANYISKKKYQKVGGDRGGITVPVHILFPL